MTPEQQEIRQRIAAIDSSYKHYSREYAYGIERTKRNLEYVQAECEHPITVKTFQISHFTESCVDCGKVFHKEQR
jgi:hypothetical protein